MPLQPTIMQTNFLAGELSPRLNAHVDFGRYGDGVALLLNWLTQPQGGAAKRAGTLYAAHTPDSSKTTRLVPFIFSQSDAYVLEFGDLTVRFYKNNAQVRESLTVTAGSWAADIATLTIGPHDATVDDEIVVAGVTPSGYDGTYRVTGIAATTVSYALTPNPGAWSSGGTVQTPLQVTTPYADTELAELDWAQSADVLYLTHLDFEPRKLSRTAATDWDLDPVVFEDGPYDLLNLTATTITPSAATGAGITLTASSIVGINGGVGFLATDVGRLVRLTPTASATQWGYAKIVGFTSTTVVTADVVEDFQDAVATDVWHLGAWSDTDGWPAAVTFFQQRLTFAGSDNVPQSSWLSRTGDFEDFTPNGRITDAKLGETYAQADATHAITLTIASGEINRIVWLLSTNVLVIGTQGGVRYIKGPDDGTGISATTIPEQKSASSFAAHAPSRPVLIGDDVLYLQAGQRKLRSLVFDRDQDSYAAADLTIVAEHITQTGLSEMAYADQPASVLWCVRGDGQLVGMTYNRNNEVFAWHRHIMGGVFGAGAAVVESVAVIPATGHDQVWVVVKRTIDGVTRRYVEYFAQPYDPPDDSEEVFYLDSALDWQGGAATVITGLDHLEGETVSVLTEGFPIPDEVVANGQITLTDSATNVKVGLAYQSDINTMPVSAGQKVGTLQGKHKKITRSIIRVQDTVGLRYGEDADSLDEEPFRDPTNPTNTAIPLFTGDKEISWTPPTSTDPRLYLRHDFALPASILGIVLEITTER